jgi:hypothetical protein
MVITATSAAWLFFSAKTEITAGKTARSTRRRMLSSQ